MPQPHLTLAAGNTGRPRLIPPVVLLAFTGLVCVTLVLLFPYRVLMDQVLREQRGDELVISYLKNLLRTDPHNTELALRLARQQYAARDITGMEHSLTEVLVSPDFDQRLSARLLLWRANEDAWHKAPEGSHERSMLQQDLLEELAALGALDLDEQTRIEIADRAFELGDSALALRLYRDIRRTASTASPDWLISRAQAREAAGSAQASIQLWLLARQRSQSLALQRECFFRAVRILIAANRPGDALALAESELGSLSDDLQSLVFMVELALRANQPATADRYARKMLRLSLAASLERLAFAEGAGLRRVADAPASGPPPGLPFDEHIYALGYEAFIGNRNLEDAWRVADFAVRQAPQSTAWRLRLARAAEWSGRPQQALAQWTWLLDEGRDLSSADHDAAAQSILRIAPGLFDDLALQKGLRYELRRRPGTPALLRALIESYEHVGQPEEGIAVMKQIVRKTPDPGSLQALFELARRAGNIDLAISSGNELIDRYGLTRERSMQLATLYVGQSQIAAAWAVLNKAQTEVPASDAVFWRLLGDLSLRLQHTANARNAYDKLVRLDASTQEDHDALIELLAESNPGAGADLALKAAERFDNWQTLLRGLELRNEAGPANLSWQTFRKLAPHWLERSENSVRFLSLRADAARAMGLGQETLRDLTRILELAPTDTSARTNLLWQLADSNKRAALQNLLTAHEQDWAQDAAIHDALAAAWLNLSAPHIALQRYLTPHLQAHRDDYLWLMTYADALEQDRQSDLAWSLRRYLLSQRPANEQRPLPANALRIARTRLQMALNPGDPALAALRGLLRLDDEAEHDQIDMKNELRLSWLLSQGEPEAARAWLWSRHARRISQPDWAMNALAMSSQDWTSLGAELEQRNNALSRDDAIVVARTINAGALASTLAFDSQTLQEQDNPLQLQLSEVLLDTAPRASLEIERRSFSRWIENERRFGWRGQLTPGLTLSLALERIDRDVDPATLIVPGSETMIGLSLSRRYGAHESRIDLARHESMNRWISLGLSHRLDFGSAGSLSLRIARHERADESLSLRALGRRDLARLESRIGLSPATSLSLALQGMRYSAQNGLALGSGWRSEAELSQRLGHSTNDTQIGMFWNYSSFSPAHHDEGSRSDALADRVPGDTSPAERIDTLMPRDYSLYGVRWASGTSFDTIWTRSIQPFASLALTYNTGSGAGYALGLGLAGRLEGADHLSASIQSEQGSNSATPRSTRLALRYWRAY